MTKKQAFLAAIRREVPDVVPVSPLIHHRYAQKLLGRSDWRAVFEVHQLLGSCHYRGPIGVGVRTSLPDGWGGDTREVERTPDGRITEEWTIATPDRVMTGRNVQGMIPHDPLVGKTTEYPVKSVEDWRAYLALRRHWLERVEGPEFSQVAEAVELMGEEGVPSVGIGCAYSVLGGVRGMQELMCDLIDYPALMDELFEVERGIQGEYVKAFIASPSEVAWLDTCWATGSDLGPERFRRWALPDVVHAMEIVRQHPGKHLGLYTLGKLRDLMPMLVEAGVHWVATFEPNQGDITLAEAKRLYGKHTAIFGNFDCLVLAFGTVEDARCEARRCLDEAMAGGGYVMVTGDEVPADAKLDNLKAMVETVQEYGRY